MRLPCSRSEATQSVLKSKDETVDLPKHTGARVAVVIPSYNTRDILRRCLQCVRNVAATIPCETVVVDNSSSDGSAEMVRTEFPEVRLIANDQNVGFAKAVNQGIAAVRTPYVLLLNSDAFLTIEALAELLRLMDSDQHIGICGPQLLNEDGSWQRSDGMAPSVLTSVLDLIGITSIRHLLRATLWRVAPHWLKPRTTGYVDGACMLIRRALVDQIGPLDERYFMYCEDVEFCVRAARHGWKVMFTPKAQVVHLRGGSTSRQSALASAQRYRDALRIYITALYGPGAWRAYARNTCWCYRRYWLVGRLLSLFGLVAPSRCTVYQAMAEVFNKPTEAQSHSRQAVDHQQVG